MVRSNQLGGYLRLMGGALLLGAFSSIGCAPVGLGEGRGSVSSRLLPPEPVVCTDSSAAAQKEGIAEWCIYQTRRDIVVQGLDEDGFGVAGLQTGFRTDNTGHLAIQMQVKDGSNFRVAHHFSSQKLETSRALTPATSQFAGIALADVAKIRAVLKKIDANPCAQDLSRIITSAAACFQNRTGTTTSCTDAADRASKTGGVCAQQRAAEAKAKATPAKAPAATTPSKSSSSSSGGASKTGSGASKTGGSSKKAASSSQDDKKKNPTTGVKKDTTDVKKTQADDKKACANQTDGTCKDGQAAVKPADATNCDSNPGQIPCQSAATKVDQSGNPLPAQGPCQDGSVVNADGSCGKQAAQGPCQDGSTVNADGSCGKSAAQGPCQDGSTVNADGSCGSTPAAQGPCQDGSTVNADGSCGSTPAAQGPCQDGSTVNADGSCGSTPAAQGPCQDGSTVSADGSCGSSQPEPFKVNDNRVLTAENETDQSGTREPNIPATQEFKTADVQTPEVVDTGVANNGPISVAEATPNNGAANSANDGNIVVSDASDSLGSSSGDTFSGGSDTAFFNRPIRMTPTLAPKSRDEESPEGDAKFA